MKSKQGFNFFLSSLLVVSAASKFVQDGQANIDHFLQYLHHILLLFRWIDTSDFILAIFPFLLMTWTEPCIKTHWNDLEDAQPQPKSQRPSHIWEEAAQSDRHQLSRGHLGVPCQASAKNSQKLTFCLIISPPQFVEIEEWTQALHVQTYLLFLLLLI